MVTHEDIYRSFRMAQSQSFGRPYRMPKDFEKHMNGRMSDINRKALCLITKWFNTKWSSINPVKYFECGFELYNNFTYHQFVDTKVIKLYIQKDKIIKLKSELNKQKIIDSVKFVKKYIKDNNIKSFGVYCMIRKDEKSLPVINYLNNNIDKYFLAWLIRDKYIHLTDYERSVIPYIIDRYRNILIELKSINNFLLKLKEKL